MSETMQKVKLTEGRWCYWRVDDHDRTMPAKFDVYEGPWEAKTKVGWCTRQHAAVVGKRQDHMRAADYEVKHREHWIRVRVIGDISDWE